MLTPLQIDKLRMIRKRDAEQELIVLRRLQLSLRRYMLNDRMLLATYEPLYQVIEEISKQLQMIGE